MNPPNDLLHPLPPPLQLRNRPPPLILNVPLQFQLPNPLLLLLRTRLHSRQDPNQILDLRDLEQQIGRQFALRGRERRRRVWRWGFGRLLRWVLSGRWSGGGGGCGRRVGTCGGCGGGFGGRSGVVGRSRSESGRWRRFGMVGGQVAD